MNIIIETNHLQETVFGEAIYCEVERRLIIYSKSQLDNVCKSCSLFHGVGQGDAIECKFKDGTNRPSMWIESYPLKKLMVQYHSKEKKLLDKIG